MIFYDFEVFAYDWLAVFIDAGEKKETVIVNNKDDLEDFYQAHKKDIWVGFNNKHYDQYILKAILCDIDPKKVSDFIIQEGRNGWEFSDAMNQIPLYTYDVFQKGRDPGLKVYEGFLGNNIEESSVPFDVDRKLTASEMEETIAYCRHDVYQTIEIFLERYSDFEAHLGLLRYYAGNHPMNFRLLSKTKVQLAALILGGTYKDRGSEFDIDFPPTLKIEKYKEVLAWYCDPKNLCYYDEDGNKKQLEITVAGVPHVFGWGGLHGARPKYSGEGYFLNMDVASLYPSLMIRYNLGSRNMHDPKRYEDIYHQRLKYKAEGNPLQAPLKICLNGTYGAMKDKTNPLYDPLQANRVCVYGQLLLLDLIEKLEPHAEIIQSNTDGILIKMRRYEDFDLIDDIAYEWEQRTHLKLEFEEYTKVFQKDVNNYILVAADGSYKSKGAYVKKLSRLDNDLPIVNKALVDYMVRNIPIEQTIGEAKNLMDFQMIARASSKYKGLMLGEKMLDVKTARVFATKECGKGLTKISKRTGKPEKVANAPPNCKLINDDVHDVPVPNWLDKNFYIQLAKKRLQDFGR